MKTDEVVRVNISTDEEHIEFERRVSYSGRVANTKYVLLIPSFIPILLINSNFFT